MNDNPKIDTKGVSNFKMQVQIAQGIQDVKTAIKNIEMTDESGVIRGLLADRPDANAEKVVPGVTLYWAVDDGWVYASDGSVWKQVVEVGAWT